MKTESYDKGSAIVIDVTFMKYTPHDGYALANPSTSAKITITDSEGNKKVDAQNLNYVSTGKYYYTIQTAADWADGMYECKIDTVDASGTDITIEPEAFYLI